MSLSHHDAERYVHFKQPCDERFITVSTRKPTLVEIGERVKKRVYPFESMPVLEPNPVYGKYVCNSCGKLTMPVDTRFLFIPRNYGSKHYFMRTRCKKCDHPIKNFFRWLWN